MLSLAALKQRFHIQVAILQVDVSYQCTEHFLFIEIAHCREDIKLNQKNCRRSYLQHQNIACPQFVEAAKDVPK